MTHNELLAKIEKQTVHIANKIRPVADECEKEIGGFANALRAVVEIHAPRTSYLFTDLVCQECGDEEERIEILYPCPTVLAITKELA